MKARHPVALSCLLFFLMLLGGLNQPAKVQADNTGPWHQYSYSAPFTSMPFVSTDRMHEAGDEANIFLYNVVLSGNHSADGADTEGAMAIQGNSTIPAKNRNGGTSSFNYAGFFDGGQHGDGDTNSHPLNEKHRISLLLGGRIQKFYPDGADNKGHALVGGAATNGRNNGYFVVRKNALFGDNNWLQDEDHPVHTNGRIYHTDDFAADPRTVAMDDIFKRIFATQSDVQTQLDQLVGTEVGDPYIVDDDPYYVRSFWGWQADDDIEVPVYHSKADASTLIIKVPVRTGTTDTAYLPGFPSSAPPIKDKRIRRIIITTDAGKVIAADTNAGDKSRQVAEKTVYWLPKAKQVTNYGLKGSWLAPDEPEVNTTAENHFTEKYFKDMQCFSTALSGSVIAPLATVAWSGAHINGYLWAKDFQQSGGAEAHNFYTPPLEELIDMMLGVDKINADDQEPVKGAEFILSRKKGTTTEYLQSAAPEKWTTNRNNAKILTSDENGQIRVRLPQPKETYRYFFHETKAPNGFEPPKPNNQHEVSPGGTAGVSYVTTVSNTPVERLAVRFRKTNQFGTALPDVKFTLTSETHPVTVLESTSGPRGYVEFENVREGHYVLKELTSNAVGPTEWRVTVKVVGGQAHLYYRDGPLIETIKNKKRLSLRLTKVDAHDRLLAGATFRLHSTNGYDKTLPEGNQALSQFTFTGLEPGTYTLTEIKAPNGYEPLKKDIKIVVSDDLTQVIADGTGLTHQGLVFAYKIANKPVGVLPATGGWGSLPWFIAAGTCGFAAINVGVGYYGTQKRGRRK
ncbi:SpaA isopeptide-forming pilin-related protein [Schleiferilactobacillus shenzhenensis]|nr:SpaA isopeptide-forming pilin-related protein [Schleiferilactobacillus shenzhenensis]